MATIIRDQDILFADGTTQSTAGQPRANLVAGTTYVAGTSPVKDISTTSYETIATFVTYGTGILTAQIYGTSTYNKYSEYIGPAYYRVLKNGIAVGSGTVNNAVPTTVSLAATFNITVTAGELITFQMALSAALYGRGYGRVATGNLPNGLVGTMYGA